MDTSLDGIQVLDLSMGVAGPYAGQLCAQHGADVVKVEPAEGDWSRRLGQPHGDISAFSTVVNRGKRSLAIDMKSAEGRAVVAELAATSDVVIEAFRPGVMRKFELDFEHVRARNPDVVYVSVSGFGQSGPASGRPGNDSVTQAYSGFMQVNRDERGKPQRLDMIAMDVVTGLYAFQAIATGLVARFRGRPAGRHVDCSLMQCALAFQATKLAEFQLEGGVPAVYVPLGVFATRDGHISVSSMRDADYVALCEALERPDLGTDPRYATRLSRVAHKERLLAEVSGTLAQRDTRDWEQRLAARGVLHAAVRGYRDVFADEQVRLLGMLTWVDQDGLADRMPVPNVPGFPTASTARARQSPHIGEHSADVLAGRGFSAEQIDRWLAAGIVQVWPLQAAPARATR